jgi:HEAT repeat protein
MSVSSTSTSSPVTEFVRALALGWKNLAAYPPGHPTLARSLEAIEQRLNDLRGPAPEIVFGVAADGLMYANEKIDSVYAQKFAYALYARGVALLRLENPSPQDLEKFLRILGVGSADAHAPIWEELTGAEVMTIHLQPVDYSTVQMTSNLDEVVKKSEPGSLWEEILRALLAGRELAPASQRLLTEGVRSVDELSALILHYVDVQGPERTFDPDATFGVRTMARAPEPAQTHQAVAKRLADTVSLYLAGCTGLKKQFAVQQVLQLLKSLPDAIASAVMRAVMRTLATDDTSASLLRDFVASIPQDEALAALKYLSTVSKISNHAMGLLQSLSVIEKPAELPPVPDSVLADLVDLFGDDDPDRFNPPDHRALLAEVSVHIPTLPAALQGTVQSLGDRVESVSDEELDRHLSRTLLELLNSLGSSHDAEPILRRLEALFRSYLRVAQYDDALETIERLQEIAITTESTDLRKSMDDAFARLADDETTQTVIECMIAAKPEMAPTIQRLIEAMGVAATRSLLITLAEESNRSRRRKLFDVVASLGPVIVPEVTRFLSDDRWYVVRNMIVLLRTVNDRTSLPEIRRIAHHRDLRVRLEAIKTLLTLEQNVPRALLDNAINDPDPKLAEIAIGLVGNYGIREGVEPLLHILGGRDVFGLRKPLRIRALKALGELAEPTALPKLDRFLRDAFLPWPTIEERRAAFESLGGYPNDLRMPFIERGLRSRDPEIREICRRLTTAN